MPSLPFYCVQDDLPSLMDVIGDDCAFIVCDGDETRWRAVTHFTPADGSTTALWHVPSGPPSIPDKVFLKPGGVPDAMPDRLIEDPWSGWTELRSRTDMIYRPDPALPIFSANEGGIFWLHINFTGKEPNSTCGVSHFGWIGAGFSKRVTSNRWAKLKRQLAKHARKVPLGGYTSGSPARIRAFSHANERLDIADINP